MGRPPLKIDVTKKDQQELRSLLKGGVQQVRVVLRALALLQLAEDVSAPQVAKTIPLTPQAILPCTMKPIPPNIFFSVSPGTSGSAARIRCARASS